MSGDGRTVWWPKDAGWWRREHVVELGEESGPAGPAVLDWLCCEAKSQNDGGWVKTGYRAIARGCFVELVTVRHVVSRAVTLGALDEFSETGQRFTCRISGWQQDNARGQAAWRKQAQRDREDAETDAAEPKRRRRAAAASHAASRGVTVGHALSQTGQDRKEEKAPPTPHAFGAGELDLLPLPPSGKRQRALAAWREQAFAWAARHGIEPRPGGPSSRHRFEHLLLHAASGDERTPAQVVALATSPAWTRSATIVDPAGATA